MKFAKLRSLSALSDLTLRALIHIEIITIFFGSLFVSVIRINENLLETLTVYPGFPKVLIYPLLWYFLLHKTKSWDRSILVASNEYYSRVIKASAYSYVLFAAFSFTVKSPISRIWVFLNVFVISVLLLILRFLIRKFVFKENNVIEGQIYIYVGSANTEEIAMRDFESAYGFVPKIVRIKPPFKEDAETWLEKLEKAILKHDAYGVIIGIGEIQDAGLLRQLADFRREQVVELLLSTRIGAITNRFERLESPLLVRIAESSLISGGFVLKRIFDIAFSILMLIVLSPILVLTALLVKVTSDGPILYVDERVGKNGKLFLMPKFRSMYVGSNSDRLSVLGRPAEDMFVKYKNDPRITSFGRFIRRWSIDELPQFWCVLLGTMSVVGPRPVLQEELEQIDPEHHVRFFAKPGLTGLWQVTGRKEVPWEDRMLRDITYIDNWSFSFDMVLILKTVGVILKGKGAV